MSIVNVVTREQFLSLFPEFGDEAFFPVVLVTTWLQQSANFVNATRWCDAYELGVCLYTAHQLALSRRNMVEGQGSGLLGNVGVVSSKSVGGVSKGYDTATGKIDEAGFFNLTTYGQQFYRLACIFGSGGAQLGTGFSYIGVWGINLGDTVAPTTWDEINNTQQVAPLAPASDNTAEGIGKQVEATKTQPEATS